MDTNNKFYMSSYDCMRILLMMLDCAVVHSTATWASNSLKGHPFVCNLGLQSFNGTCVATVCNLGSLGLDSLRLKFALVRIL